LKITALNRTRVVALKL